MVVEVVVVVVVVVIVVVVVVEVVVIVVVEVVVVVMMVVLTGFSCMFGFEKSTEITENGAFSTRPWPTLKQ